MGRGLPDQSERWDNGDDNNKNNNNNDDDDDNCDDDGDECKVGRSPQHQVVQVALSPAKSR